jgi:hypothetical protein
MMMPHDSCIANAMRDSSTACVFAALTLAATAHNKGHPSWFGIEHRRAVEERRRSTLEQKPAAHTEVCQIGGRTCVKSQL